VIVLTGAAAQPVCLRAMMLISLWKLRLDGRMFRWFAPLLLFAAKPDVLVRVLTAAIAAAVLVLGVWLISNIALTVDALKNPTIAAIYGVVLFCFFFGVGTVAWLRLRRSPAEQRKLTAPVAQPEIPLAPEIVTKRAAEISRTWERDNRRPVPELKSPPRPEPAAAPAPAPRLPGAPVRATLTVTGPAYTGRTALIGAIEKAAAPAAASDVVRLLDAGSIDGDEQQLSALVAVAAATDGVLFVVDQDLRAPEVAAIRRLLGTGKPLYVALNKSDQFSAADRDAILVSIRAKMPAGFPPGNVVAVAGLPSAVEREIEDARGAVRVELRRPSSDVAALTNLLARSYPPKSGLTGRPLRFEAQS
jgi:hypothetical protein